MRTSFSLTLGLLLASSSALAREPAPVIEPPVGVTPAPRAASSSTVPNAGFHGGVPYVKDSRDRFRLYLQGRMQIDSYQYFGRGVSQTQLTSTLVLRRVRPEISGEILDTWQFMIAGDWGGTGLDNPNGTNESQAAAPGSPPTATTGRYASAQTPAVRSSPTDVFINWRGGELANVQVGQFNAPFTMENPTSDKYLPFLERSLPVRAVGIPNNKELGVMFWGNTRDRSFNYALGVFDGDGQNRPNPDNRYDVIGRVFVYPAARAPGRVKHAHLGASGRWGRRDSHHVNHDFPAMTTQGGFPFWSPVYVGADGRRLHVVPSSQQLALAGEARVPFHRFDLTGELVYVDARTREAVEGFQATNTERFGAMKGTSAYLQLGVWVAGTPDVVGQPGQMRPTRVDFSKPDPEELPWGVQLLAKIETIRLRYTGASRAGVPDAVGADGDIRVDAASLGVNYWATRHLRLALNYVLYRFPDSAPVRPSAPGGPQQTASQRALAPGNTIDRGRDDAARDGAHAHHELLARAAVAFLRRRHLRNAASTRPSRSWPQYKSSPSTMKVGAPNTPRFAASSVAVFSASFTAGVCAAATAASASAPSSSRRTASSAMSRSSAQYALNTRSRNAARLASGSARYNRSAFSELVGNRLGNFIGTPQCSDQRIMSLNV